jgi:mono/diheme cytochrome c family protein
VIESASLNWRRPLVAQAFRPANGRRAALKGCATFNGARRYKHAPLIALTLTSVAFMAACTRPPDQALTESNALYDQNCAGCHGADGNGGAARGLIDPVFLEIADEATIRRITAAGVPGTAMPAFAMESGGSLTDEQIDSIVRSIRGTWTSAGAANDSNPPPYSTSTAGDPTRGGEAFATFCARCHGADGRGGQGFQASSIVDASSLALVSDQSLRTTVIAGRPDLGAPDWRGNVPGRPMSPEDVSDVVAWLAAKRPQG